MKKTFLSGIQPSGILHIGNYLGAIAQWVKLQETHRAFIMVADLHAITAPQEPKQLRERTLEVAKLLLACGINSEKSTLFIQSHVPAHSELAWILNTITPIGELERMTQFKDKSREKFQNQDFETDEGAERLRTGVLAGLLNYPVLMAADILLYQAAVVPVGEDQVQHVELTRTIARKFNNQFGKTFTLPQAMVMDDTARIKGLDNPAKKMSKSAPSADNYIALLDSPDTIHGKIKAAVTDSGHDIVYNEEEKPAVANLMRIYRAFSHPYDGVSNMTFKQIEEQFAGVGYAQFKEALAELIVDKLAPVRERFVELSANAEQLATILQHGAKQAHTLARHTLQQVHERVGLVWDVTT